MVTRAVMRGAAFGVSVCDREKGSAFGATTKCAHALCFFITSPWPHLGHSPNRAHDRPPSHSIPNRSI
jgi:hypothetical protein